jgi:hypothetical protein
MYFIIKGRFVLKKNLCTELVVPDLTDFKLKPYVAVVAKRNIRDVNVQL